MTVAEETRITLQEAAELLRVHPRTVRAYGSVGVNGTKLEHIPRPGKWETSREAVSRFLRAITVAANDAGPVEPAVSHEHRRAELQAKVKGSRKAKGKGVKAK